MSLVPEDCANREKIPYLKIGDDIGKRATVCHGKGIIIEDVQDFDGTVIRKLFFETKLEQIQSEVNIKRVNKEEEGPLTKSKLFPEDEKTKVIINHKVLCSDYERAIIAGLATIPGLVVEKPQFKILVLGTGAGVFPMFMKSNVPNAVIHAVDKDAETLKLGEEYFGFRPDERLVSHCKMAEEYLKELGEKKEKNPYDMVIVDINNPDLSTGISPSENFYSKDFLSQLKAIAGENEFMVAINTIFRGNEAKRVEAIEVFKQLFEVVFSIKSDKEANEVFFMISAKSVAPENYQKTNITTQLYGLQKHLGVSWTKATNILELVDSMILYKPKETEAKKTHDKKKKKKK